MKLYVITYTPENTPGVEVFADRDLAVERYEKLAAKHEHEDSGLVASDTDEVSVWCNDDALIQFSTVNVYRSRCARDAEAMGYGGKSYWDMLDEAAQRHYDFFMARGDAAKAESMLTETLSQALAGNDGD